MPGGALVADHFAVDFNHRLPHAAAGALAFAAIDRRHPRRELMALAVSATAPPRNVASLWTSPPPGMLAPIAHGAGRDAVGRLGWFVICDAPPGPPVWEAGQVSIPSWSEADIVACLLRPVATALAALHDQRITHRAIRPENLFRAGNAFTASPSEPVVLGAAWAAPPGSRQSALHEPPYSAMCLPAGRGEGRPADDIYALGVTMLALALGRLPLAGLDEAAIIRRKLELGSYAALVGQDRLPPVVADLARGMLAEDPEHRPAAALLLDPAAARARRVAARPPRRAQRPLLFGSREVWDASSCAYALATEAEQGTRLLRSGALDTWLRRGLGAPTLAARLEECLRQAAEARGDALQAASQAANLPDALLTMRAVALLDPLAPLCWRGVAVWPDGLGPALAAAADGAQDLARLTELIENEVPADWAVMRADRMDPVRARLDARQMAATLRQPGLGGGVARLRYTLNSLLACRSTLVQPALVVRLTDLLPALDQHQATDQHQESGGIPMDREIAAFVVARQDRRFETDLATLDRGGPSGQAMMAALRILATIQSLFGVGPVPRLAGWLVGGLRDTVAESWRNTNRRSAVEQALAALPGAGSLVAILALLDDQAGRAADASAAADAARAVAAIDAELARIAAGSGERAEAARRVGGELAASAGLAVLALMGVMAALSP